MTMTGIATVIALICGFIVGSAVTIGWEWSRFRKVHRRYQRGR